MFQVILYKKPNGDGVEIMKNLNEVDYTEFSDLFNDPEYLDPAEREEIEFEVALIGKMIEIRDELGLTQKKLAEITGLKQPAIARIESMKNAPNLSTIFKLLKPLGYTLAIVKEDEAVNETGKNSRRIKSAL